MSESTKCQDIQASIKILLDGKDAKVIEEGYKAGLTKAIKEGKLQEKLDEVNPDAVVSVLTGVNLPDRGISTIAIGAIVVAGIVCSLAILALLVVARRRKSGSLDQKDDNSFPSTPVESPQTLENGVVGATGADYGKNAKKAPVVAFGNLEEADDIEAAGASHDSSSNAGSSGWSSSAGVSSLNTGSVDSGFGSKDATGANLAEMGAASAVAGIAVKDRYVTFSCEACIGGYETVFSNFSVFFLHCIDLMRALMCLRFRK